MPSPPVEIHELVERHYAEVYRYALRLCGSAAEADDLVQEAFLTAHSKGAQIRDLQGARAWLYAVVRNAYLKLLRSPARKRSRALEQIPEPVIADEAHTLNLEFDAEALHRALQELHEEYRAPLVLYYFGELSYREIAEQMQVPIGTVMSRLSRAKAWLRDRMSANAPRGRVPVAQGNTL